MSLFISLSLLSFIRTADNSGCYRDGLAGTGETSGHSEHEAAERRVPPGEDVAGLQTPLPNLSQATERDTYMFAAIRNAAAYAVALVRSDERGQTVAEYAMIIGFVSIALVIAFLVFGLDDAISDLIIEIDSLIGGTNTRS